jgi:hypothetical protein
MTYDLTKLETKQATGIGSVSCVGVLKMGFPLNHGNYFGVTTSDGGYEVFNMYYEDLEHLIETKVVDFPIQINSLDLLFKDKPMFGVVADSFYLIIQIYCWACMVLENGIIMIFNMKRV